MNCRMLVTLSLIMIVGVLANAAEPIKVQSALVRLLEQADIPAREVGVLETLEVREGDLVKAGQVLSRLDDEDAKLAVARAELDLEIANRQVKNSVPVRTAEALLKETQQDLTQAKLSQRIAAMKAANDVAVRHAMKSRDASKAEYDRAVQARKAFEKSISLTDLDRLRLILDRNELEIEKAQFEKDLAELQQQIEDSSIIEQNQIVERLKLSVDQALQQKEVDALTSDAKARTLDQAKLQLARRSLRSPLDGEVAEIFRYRGEWVEPGQRVMRIVRLDRLKVEGFVNSREITRSLRGVAVRVRVTPNDAEKPVTVKGKIVFVSSEIDPVNAQVRVWAEVENPELLLRPGLPAEMVIDVTNRTETNAASPTKTSGER